MKMSLFSVKQLVLVSAIQLVLIPSAVHADIAPNELDGVITTPRVPNLIEETIFKTDPDHSTSSPGANLGFIHAFVASLSVILVSELGDKTFFIAAIMAMRHPRITVFIGAIAALALMTVLSVVFGMVTTIVPRAVTYYVSTILFIIFGLKMLREGYKMSPTEAQEELEEVQSDLRKRDDEMMRKACKGKDSPPQRTKFEQGRNPEEGEGFCHVSQNGDHLEIVETPLTPSETVPSETRLSPKLHANGTLTNGDLDVITIVRVNSSSSTVSHAGKNGVEVLPKFEKEALTGDVESGKSYQPTTMTLLSRVLIQAFTLTFLAEWGDRSQLTTIILAAREDAYGVALGGILGHSFCTGLAVIGGRFIAQRISVRTVTITGGIVFLVFALTALLFDPSDS